MKTIHTPESLARVASCPTEGADSQPDVVVKIPSIGVDYVQHGTMDMRRAIKILRHASDALEGKMRK